MYKVIKSVIESKRYELAEMLTKIDTFWVQGGITEEERNELVALARENALPENSYAGIQEQLTTLFKTVAELEQRVATLEGASEEDSSDTEEYPEYVQPTGAHDAYKIGDRVTYNGNRYLCVAPEGVAVVWSPDVMPDYWHLLTDEELVE